MKTLVGDQRCETGIESVDAQYRRLLEIINQLGDSRTTILLEGLERLYSQFCEQNRNLTESNRSLESTLEQRTSELAQVLKRVEVTQQQLLK